MSYAVIWSERGGPRYAGALEIGERCLTLSGTAGGFHTQRRLTYAGLAAMHVERRPDRRLGGRPTLVLEHKAAGCLGVVAIDGAGTLHEVVERVAAARERAAKRAA